METWALVITWSTAFWSMCSPDSGHPQVPSQRPSGKTELWHLEQVGLALHLGCDGPRQGIHAQSLADPLLHQMALNMLEYFTATSLAAL